MIGFRRDITVGLDFVHRTLERGHVRIELNVRMLHHWRRRQARRRRPGGRDGQQAAEVEWTNCLTTFMSAHTRRALRVDVDFTLVVGAHAGRARAPGLLFQRKTNLIKSEPTGAHLLPSTVMNVHKYQF